MHDVTVDHHDRAPLADVDAVERDVRTRVVEPAVPATVAVPPVVIDSVRRPVEIVAEPAADRIPDAERPVGGAHAEVVHRAIVDHLRIVDGHVDHRRLCRHDADRVALDLHSLLRGGDEIPLLACHLAQALHARHHVARLQRVRSADRRRPVGAVGKHVEHGLVARDRLHAHVPCLIVDPDSAVGRDVARSQLHLLRIRRGDQQLREDRIRIERDWCEEVIELLDGVELLVLGCFRPNGRLLRSDRCREGEGANGTRKSEREAKGCGGTGHTVSGVTVYPVVPWRESGVPGSSTLTIALRYVVHPE